MPAAVASRYARALADLSSKPESPVQPNRLVEEMQAIERAWASSPGLRNVLLSPAVPPPRKRAVVAALAGKMSLSGLLKRFLFVLIDHRRTALLSEIREAFEAVIDERLGLVRVEVSSAQELTHPQRQALAAALTRLTGREARSRFWVRPDLIGGLVARIGSTIYDGSVLGQLEGLRQRLASRGS
jgi:F-type H+-transporting ATPase subunit delta